LAAGQEGQGPICKRLLTSPLPAPNCEAARRAGWPRGGQPPRGKSGLHEAAVPGNARAGKPDGKRHREQSAAQVAARVKRWSKSPPRPWQQGRHGKPHREQCQIGPPRGTRRFRPIPPLGRFSREGSGWQLEAPGNRRTRGMVIEGGNPGTESGLQALRAHFPGLALLTRRVRRVKAQPQDRIQPKGPCLFGRRR